MWTGKKKTESKTYVCYPQSLQLFWTDLTLALAFALCDRWMEMPRRPPLTLSWGESVAQSLQVASLRSLPRSIDSGKRVVPSGSCCLISWSNVMVIRRFMQSTMQSLNINYYMHSRLMSCWCICVCAYTSTNGQPCWRSNSKSTLSTCRKSLAETMSMWRRVSTRRRRWKQPWVGRSHVLSHVEPWWI